MFQKSGAPMETDAHSRALLNISFGVLSKGALPPGPPHEVPLDRDALFLEPSSPVVKSARVWRWPYTLISYPGKESYHHSSVQHHYILSSTIYCMLPSIHIFLVWNVFIESDLSGTIPP
jgi:hypothetical protein